MDIPAWLPGVVTAVVLNGLQYAVFTGRAMQRLEDFKEAHDELKQEKLDAKVHDIEIKRIDGRLANAFEEISRERHRLNNIEQRGKAIG